MSNARSAPAAFHVGRVRRKCPERRTMAIRKQQEQFIHLVRLAWDLRMAGLSATIDLPRGGEPAVLILGAKGPLKVMVSTQGADWFFT